MIPVQSAANEALEELRSQLKSLHDRLARIEKHLGLEAQTPEAAPAALALAPESAWSETGTLAALLGKSLLGLALAYLLRAFAESGSIAVPAGVAIGIGYAVLWLLWAARTPAEETATVGLRALTAVLVIVPLLWEAHVRFQALSSWTTAGTLVVFSVAGLVISWRKNLVSVAWITSLGSLAACLALLVKTQDLLPYTTALLALALAVEVSACLEHYLGERWVVALSVDLAVLLLTFVATRPAGSLSGYAPLAVAAVLAVQIALVAIYLSSTIVRTLLRGFRIASFEIAQSATAVAVAGMGAIRVASGHEGAVLLVGLFCALCGVACYVVSLAFLDHGEESDRNFHTYALFGLALTLAGTRLLLAGDLLVMAWCGLPLLCVLVGRRAGRSTLKAHAAVYLLLASAVSGAAGFANGRFLAESAHPGPPPAVGMGLVALSAAFCYGLLLRGAIPPAAGFMYRGACALLAATAVWIGGGLAGALLAPACRNAPGQPDRPDFCPTLLTALLIGLALGLSWFARRWRRPELRWVSLLLTAAASYKLLFQDFRQAHTFALVLSLAAYGLCLILLPRLGQGPGRATVARRG